MNSGKSKRKQRDTYLSLVDQAARVLLLYDCERYEESDINGIGNRFIASNGGNAGDDRGTPRLHKPAILTGVTSRIY
jgi:hypothetical protein